MDDLSPSADTAFPLLPRIFTLPENSPALRLDAALAHIFPALGLRGRRRLWEYCRISVNGRPRPPGHLLRPGESVCVEDGRTKDAGAVSVSPASMDPASISAKPEQTPASPALLRLGEGYAALYKPEGLHTAHISGSPEPDLESMLPGLWPEWRRQWQERNAADQTAPERQCAAPTLGHMPLPGPEADASLPTPDTDAPPRLLTRLDRATSGILLAALCAEREDAFRRYEREGLVEKTYLALVRGNLDRPLRLTGQLRVDRRERSLVLKRDDPDTTRHTHVAPLAPLTPLWLRSLGLCGTLVRLCIKRGARHQIRAHLAAAGYPLAGEWLYAPPLPEAPRLYLHHAAVRLPGFAAAFPPEWGFSLLKDCY